MIQTFIDFINELFVHRAGSMDKPDPEDWEAKIAQPIGFKNPNKRKYPSIYAQNQWQTMHCSAYSPAHSASIMCKHQLRRSVTIEGAEVWGLQKRMGTATEKNGDYIQNGLKAICKYGIRIKGSTYIFKPRGYAKVEKTVDEFKQRLSNNQPVMTGGYIRTPMITFKEKIFRPRKRRIMGHAFSVIGWDDHKEVFLCINSWGGKWGFGGAFFLKYSDIHKLMTPFVFLTDEPFLVLPPKN